MKSLNLIAIVFLFWGCGPTPDPSNVTRYSLKIFTNQNSNLSNTFKDVILPFNIPNGNKESIYAPDTLSRLYWFDEKYLAGVNIGFEKLSNRAMGFGGISKFKKINQYCENKGYPKIKFDNLNEGNAIPYQTYFELFEKSNIDIGSSELFFMISDESKLKPDFIQYLRTSGAKWSYYSSMDSLLQNLKSRIVKIQNSVVVFHDPNLLYDQEIIESSIPEENEDAIRMEELLQNAYINYDLGKFKSACDFFKEAQELGELSKSDKTKMQKACSKINRSRIEITPKTRVVCDCDISILLGTDQISWKGCEGYSYSYTLKRISTSSSESELFKGKTSASGNKVSITNLGINDSHYYEFTLTASKPNCESVTRYKRFNLSNSLTGKYDRIDPRCK
jgi:hypothetical protein